MTLALAALNLVLGLNARASSPGASPVSPADKSLGTRPAAAASVVANSQNDLSVPHSIFVVPRVPEQGKDPFYPRSTRVYNTTGPALPQTTNAPVVQIALKLTGISGSSDRRLAMINNKTFETGEEQEIINGASHIRIRCVEIGPDSAIIFMNGERRELRLRKGIL
jgi:hypothetical protein